MKYFKWLIMGIILISAGYIFLQIYISNMQKPLYTSGKIKPRVETGKIQLNIPGQSLENKNFWKVDTNVLIFHFSAGSGEDVLIIHGGPGQPPVQEWKGLEKLKNNYKFHYYHQRGCGKSTRPIKSFKSKNFIKNRDELYSKLGIETQLLDIEKIRSILKKEKITIIGHSFGAFFAVMYAIEFPERVKSLILISPADVLKMNKNKKTLFDYIMQALPVQMKNEFTGFIKRYFNFGKLFKKNEQELIEQNNELGKYFYAAYKEKENNLNPELNNPDYTGGFMVYAIYLGLGRNVDYTEFVNKIKAPVLIIAGEKDILPLSTFKDYKNNISQLKFIVIKNAGHFSYEETPEQFSNIINDFLRDKTGINK